MPEPQVATPFAPRAKHRNADADVGTMATTVNATKAATKKRLITNLHDFKHTTLTHKQYRTAQRGVRVGKKGAPTFTSRGLVFLAKVAPLETLAPRGKHIRFVPGWSRKLQAGINSLSLARRSCSSSGLLTAVLGLAILCQRPLYDLKNLRRGARRQPLTWMKIDELTDLKFVVGHQWIGPLSRSICGMKSAGIRGRSPSLG